MREERTEVLIVGAGPVGLWIALLLARAGVETIVIDREERTTSRSYACALHPGTLKLLEQAGVAGAILEQGRRLGTVAFYDAKSRRAEIKLAETGGDFPFLVVLPQNALENELEKALRAAGSGVHWNHRFDDLAEEPERITVTVEELGGTGTGYVVPHWEMGVKRRSTLQAKFLIGADGHNSLVRERLAIKPERSGRPEFFAAYEFASGDPGPDEMRVVLDESTTNVLWPLPGGRFRWTFQMTPGPAPEEFPEKERRNARLARAAVDERIRQYVQKVAHERAPWFTGSVKEIAWCTEVVFERSLARPLGRSRCWLAGDAAHQTGPVGVQSMNAAFAEGSQLARALTRILREDAPLDGLADWAREQEQQWRQMLGLAGQLRPNSETAPWVRDRSDRLLPCLPGTGLELVRLAGRLGLAFSPSAE